MPYVSMITGIVLLALVDPAIKRIQVTNIERDTLRGLVSAKIIVENLNASVANCNVTRESIELAAARPLIDGGIKVVEGNAASGATASVYVNVTGGTTSCGCAMVIDVTAYTLAFAILPHSPVKTPVQVPVELWENSTLLTGPASNFGDRVTSTVRKFVDELVTKVKLANQK